MRGIENIELNDNEMAILISGLIALVALIHTSPLSLYIVLPVISIFLLKILRVEFSGFRFNKLFSNKK